MKTRVVKKKKEDIIEDVIFNTFWEMLSAKQRKTLRYIFSIYPVSLADAKHNVLGRSIIISKNGLIKYTEQLKSKIIEAYKIGSFTYSESEFQKVWWVIYQRHSQNKKTNYKAKPKKEGRDNKDVIVGSGGGSLHSSIRFPKKIANKSVWKKFWKLFPFLEGCKSWEEYHIKQAKDDEII